MAKFSKSKVKSPESKAKSPESKAKSPESKAKSTEGDASYMFSCFALFMIYLSYYQDVKKFSTKTPKPESMIVLQQYLKEGMIKYNIKLSPAEFEKFTMLSFMYLKLISEGYVIIPGATAEDYQEFKTWLGETQPVETSKQRILAPYRFPVMRTGLPTDAATPATPATPLVAPVRGGMPHRRRSLTPSPPASDSDSDSADSDSAAVQALVPYGERFPPRRRPSILTYLYNLGLFFGILFSIYLLWKAWVDVQNLPQHTVDVIGENLHTLVPGADDVGRLSKAQIDELAQQALPQIAAADTGMPSVPTGAANFKLLDIIQAIFTGNIDALTEIGERLSDGATEVVTRISNQLYREFITVASQNAEHARAALAANADRTMPNLAEQGWYDTLKQILGAGDAVGRTIKSGTIEATSAVATTTAENIHILRMFALRFDLTIERIAHRLTISVGDIRNVIVYAIRLMGFFSALLMQQWYSHRERPQLRITKDPDHRSDKSTQGGRRRKSSKRKSSRKTQKHRRRRPTKKRSKRPTKKRSKRSKRPTKKRSKRSKR